MSEGLSKLYEWVLERLKEAQRCALDDHCGYDLLWWAGKIDAYNRAAEVIMNIMHEEENR